MLWIFVANIVSFLWCVYNTQTICVDILMLSIFIKMYLLRSDTSTTHKERYV